MMWNIRKKRKVLKQKTIIHNRIRKQKLAWGTCHGPSNPTSVLNSTSTEPNQLRTRKRKTIKRHYYIMYRMK